MTNDFNPVEMAKSSKTFCIFPWIQQYVGPPGDVKPCCVYDNQDEIGSLKENTLAEIWNNDKTKQMRLNFLNGIEEPSCSICNRRAVLGHAHKNEYNRMFFDNDEEIQKIVANTNPDGSLDEHKLFYIDVRYNNLCNLSCRSCAPHFSTSWVMDHRKLYNLVERRDKDDGFQFPGKTEEQALEEILPHLATAKMIYFAGGEPLMQKEHYEVLNKLIELDNTDLEIRYNTNFSKLTHSVYDVIDYWKKFKVVCVVASLDGSYERAEYWRKGTDWSTIVENRKSLIKNCPRVVFIIGFTLSWVNAFNLLDFHKEWINLKYINIDSININMLDDPEAYSLKNIPSWKKKKIELAFLKHIEWLNERKAKDKTKNQFVNAINFMNSIDTGDNFIEISKFMITTEQLDKLRNENFWDVFPEHTDMKELIYGSNSVQKLPSTN